MGRDMITLNGLIGSGGLSVGSLVGKDMFVMI